MSCFENVYKVFSGHQKHIDVEFKLFENIEVKTLGRLSRVPISGFRRSVLEIYSVFHPFFFRLCPFFISKILIDSGHLRGRNIVAAVMVENERRR